MTVVKKKGRVQLRDEKVLFVLALVLFSLVVARLGEVSALAVKVRPVLVTLAITAVFFIQAQRRIGLAKVMNDKIFRLSVLYFGWLIFTIPFSIWRGRSFDVLNIIPIALFLLLTLSAVTPEKKTLEKFIKWVVVLTGVSGLITLKAGVSQVGRLSTGGMLDPNDLASLLASILPYGLAIGMGMAKGKILHKLMAWGGVFVMAMVLLQTGSRGGLVALMAGLLVVSLRLNPQRMVTFALVASVLAPVIWTQTPPELRERFAGMGSLGGDYNMTEDYGRIATWKRGLGYIIGNPVTGLGYGNFTTAEGFRMRDVGGQGPYYSAHNAYIQAFAEQGFIGGILFLMIIFEGARRGARLWRAGRPEYLASLAAFSAGAVFLSHAYSYILFGVLGIIVVASRTLDPEGAGLVNKGAARRALLARKRGAPAGGTPLPAGAVSDMQGAPQAGMRPQPHGTPPQNQGMPPQPPGMQAPVQGIPEPRQGRPPSPLFYPKA